MDKRDVFGCRLLLVGSGIVIFLGALYSLLWEWQWHRLLIALAGLLLIVLAMRVEK